MRHIAAALALALLSTSAHALEPDFSEMTRKDCHLVARYSAGTALERDYQNYSRAQSEETTRQALTTGLIPQMTQQWHYTNEHALAVAMLIRDHTTDVYRGGPLELSRLDVTDVYMMTFDDCMIRAGIFLD